MWFFNKKNATKPNHEPEPITTTIKDIEKAILQFENDMPDSIKRTVLVDKDNRIDTTRLARYLGGIPIENYYMSTQTYDLFTEEDRMFAHYLDVVQSAVDNYVDEYNRLPIVPNSRDRKVHYDLLVQNFYLKEKPPFPLYITDDEYMLSHTKH